MDEVIESIEPSEALHKFEVQLAKEIKKRPAIYNNDFTTTDQRDKLFLEVTEALNTEWALEKTSKFIYLFIYLLYL